MIKKRKIGQTEGVGFGWHILMLAFAAFCIIPLFLVVGISFTAEQEIYATGYKFIPQEISFEAYSYIFKTPMTIIRGYGVTIFVTIVGTIISLIVTAALGYTMARKDYFLSRPISFLVFFAMLFSGGVVPWYIVISQWLKLKNTIWAMILPYTIIPWFVLLMKGFFQSVPKEIIESAKIDGCSELRAFISIVIPISTSAITTVGLFIALNYWNDYKLALYFVQESKMYPLQYMLQQIMSNLNFMRTSMMSAIGMSVHVEMPSESVRMGMCLLAAGPMLLVFPFFQKYFVKGITVGSIKG